MAVLIAIFTSRENHSQTTVMNSAWGKDVGEVRFLFCENVARKASQGDCGQ